MSSSEIRPSIGLSRSFSFGICQYRTLRSRQNRFSVVRAIATAALKLAFDGTNPLSQFYFYRRDDVLAAFHFREG